MKAPKLRFPGFEEEWSENKLGEIAEIKDSARISNAFWVEKGIPYLRSSDLVNDELHGELFISKETYDKYSSQTGAPQKGDLLFTSGGKVGVTYHKEDESEVYVQGGAVLYVRTSTSEYLDGSFLNIYFSSHKMKKYMENASVGGTIKHFTLSPANATPIIYPSIKEQQKIGSLFNLINKKIQLQQEKINLLKEQKKGLMHKIFSQELRFKDENGQEFPDWMKQPLNNFSERVTRKNSELLTTRPLTISAQHGLIDQTEFFNKTVASENLTGYYLLKNGEFAYNKSYSNGYPLGAIKRLDSYKNGALSTLYICFSIKENVNSDFLVHYFDSSKWHQEIALICVEGARNHGLLNVSVSEFFETQHDLPCLEEQKKIAEFFNKINEKIQFNEQNLMNLQQQKQAFMQQMFI